MSLIGIFATVFVFSSIFLPLNFTILGKAGCLYDSATAVQHFESYFTIVHRIRNRNKPSAACSLIEERKKFLCFEIAKLILELTHDCAIIEDNLTFLEATAQPNDIRPYECTDVEFEYYQHDERKTKKHSKQMYLCPDYDIILNGIRTTSPSFFVSRGDVKNSAFILNKVFAQPKPKSMLSYYADELGYESGKPALEGIKIAAEYLDLYYFSTKLLKDEKVADEFEKIDKLLCQSTEETKTRLCFQIMKILVVRRYGRVEYYENEIIEELKDSMDCHKETFTCQEYSEFSGSTGAKMMYSCPKYTLKIWHAFIPNEKIDTDVEFYVSGGDKTNTCIVFENEESENVLISTYYGYDFEF